MDKRHRPAIVAAMHLTAHRVRRPALLSVLLATAWVLLATRAPAAVSLQEIASGYVSPVLLSPLPGAKGELLIGDQVGVIYRLDPSGQQAATPFLDLRSRLTTLRSNFDERGLLGLAFHPRFQANRKFYVYYSAPLRDGAPKGWDHTSHLSEFTVRADNPREADPDSERVLLQVDQPQFNHNGGRIAFGPDGLLYVGLGDGGQGNDKGEGHAPEGNGQNKDTLLGKILRLDVDRKDPGLEYGIPKDNPFAKGGGRPEIFAWGIRNPWGMSFDRGGRRQLFAADVGQTMWEEVNIIEKGGNYGWRLREGFVGFNPDKPTSPPEDAPTTAADGTPLRDPILAYKNFKGHPGDPDLKGTSVTGGYVYRGKAIKELRGRYVFADWSKNWGVADGILLLGTPPKSRTQKRWSVEPLPLVNKPPGLLGYVVAMGEDDDGELYALTTQRNALSGTTGKVYKLVPAPGK
jgi:glucose/arabinose dehydrogenase